MFIGALYWWIMELWKFEWNSTHLRPNPCSVATGGWIRRRRCDVIMNTSLCWVVSRFRYEVLSISWKLFSSREMIELWNILNCRATSPMDVSLRKIPMPSCLYGIHSLVLVLHMALPFVSFCMFHWRGYLYTSVWRRHGLFVCFCLFSWHGYLDPPVRQSTYRSMKG